MIMPFLPSLPKGASLLDLFKAFPETSIPLIQFHEELVDSRIDIDGAAVDPKMRPVLRYARKLTQQPSSLTQADANAIFAAGWEGAALYYTVAVTALFNFMNRLVEGMGIELDPSYLRPASECLAKRGYLPLIDMISH